MKYPMAFITIPILLGVIFAYYIETEFLGLLFLLIMSTLISLVAIKFNYSMGTGLFISLFLLGIFITSLRSNNSQLKDYINQEIKLRGNIVEIRDIFEDRERYVVKVDGSEKIILNIIGQAELSLGDEIIFNAVLKEPATNTNPKLYNYKLNLLGDNIFTTATIKEYQIIDAEPKTNALLTMRESFVEKVEDIYDTYLNEQNSSVMKGIVLGKYSYLEEDTINRFRDLGLAHIISVSGLHIGVITGLLIKIFSFLRFDRKISIVLSIFIIWFYAYLIGFPVSVLRANIMFTTLLLSQLIAKPYDSLNGLLFAMLVLILLNPFWIFDVGFQLSFVASFFIIYLTPKFSILINSKGSSLMQSLSAILAAQIGLLPILAYYFNRVPIIGIIANLLLVPLFNISLVLSIILAPFSYLSIYIASSIANITNIILNFQALVSEILNSFPILVLKIPSPSIDNIIIYYIVIFTLFASINIRKLPKEIVKVMVVYLIFLITFNYTYISFDNSLTIEFIDVGQGDSALIKTKEGNYLIDTGGSIFGSYDIGKNVLLPYLEKDGIFNLKGVFISHFHDDHSKSLPYLMDNMYIENIYIGYANDDNSLYGDIKYKADEKNIPINILKKGDNLILDKYTDIITLGPSDELLKFSHDEDNEISQVLLLRYFNKNILFTGDIEQKGEKNVIETLDTDIDFLKVPHHGSKTSSGEDFIDLLDPKIGIISVGRNNIYDHPNEDVIERYKNNNTSLYRTDESGRIRLVLDEYDFSIETFIREKMHINSIREFYGQYIVLLIAYFLVIYIKIKYYVTLKKGIKTIEIKRIY